ncbi:MAG: hypothetical protein OXH75_18875 [Acidobacteria bacterium]|nr:hypothetical protein [Acidobacteriota bacterium]
MISLGIAQPPRPEVRADATALAINAIVTAATATSVQTWAAAAVEIAAGQWGRALATVGVPDGVPVGPSWLAEAGRDLARRGEALYLLDVAPRGRLRLLRATSADVWGDGPDPADWWYRLTVAGPHSTRTVTAPAAAVVHLRFATEPHAPARGLSPLRFASLTGTLTAQLEQALGYEAAGPVANLIALPEGFNGQPPADDGTQTGHDAPTPADELAESIRTAKGRTLLPETTAAAYGDNTARAPRRDWEPARLGADPPMALVTLRGAVENSVLACYGVPAPLGPLGITDGTAQREALRRFWTLTVQPLADMVSEELERVLERPVSLAIGRAAGTADVAARARAVKALTDAGVDKGDAMRRVGWEPEPETQP